MNRGPLRSRNINSFGLVRSGEAQRERSSRHVAMLRFTLSRLAALLATVLITAWLVFALLAPAGNFFGWLGHMLLGDFGTSASAGGPVGALLAARLGVAIPLARLAME